MIVVVEGPSAAGKTAWCRVHFPDAHVPEAEGVDGEWAAANARQWLAATAMERRLGTAVCDTDPFKLHYAWGMWMIGQLPRSRWDGERSSAPEAFAAGRLGLADLALVSIPDEATLRARRTEDASRPRRNFERHVRLAAPLRQWYEAIDSADPGRVRWELNDRGLPEPLPPPRTDRSSVQLFDSVISALPRR